MRKKIKSGYYRVRVDDYIYVFSKYNIRVLKKLYLPFGACSKCPLLVNGIKTCFDMKNPINSDEDFYDFCLYIDYKLKENETSVFYEKKKRNRL